MRIWYFGHYMEWYPRNRVIRKGLARAGAELIEAPVPANRILRWPGMVLKASRLAGKSPEVIIVPECDLESFPAAWAIGRGLGAVVVYDAFYSRWDALVNDEIEISRVSLKARLTWQLESFALRHADLVLCDTAAHGEYIADCYGARRDKFETVYIGADDELFYPRPNGDNREFLVHYNGFYHRLQGAPAIIEAAAMLRDKPEIRFEMIGTRASPAFKEVMAKFNQHKLANVNFVDTLPIDQMPGRMARAGVCLGIFGKTGFGERVFPNKGFQTLAMAIALITRESKGSREVGISGKHFLAVAPEDGRALAEAILLLKNDPARRKSIAAEGKQLYDQRFCPGAVGKILLSRLERELRKGRA